MQSFQVVQFLEWGWWVVDPFQVLEVGAMVGSLSSSSSSCTWCNGWQWVQWMRMVVGCVVVCDSLFELLHAFQVVQFLRGGKVGKFWKV